MEITDQSFILNWFQNYLKDQYTAIYQKKNHLNNLRDSSSQSQDDDLFEPCEELDNKIDIDEEYFATTPIENEFSSTLHELDRKLDRLNSLFCMDDLDLMTFDDVTDSEFIISFLTYICPKEFNSRNLGTKKDPYINICYQLKNFLDSRNFKSGKYLKELKDRFEKTIYLDEVRHELIRVVILVCFLLKDSSDSEHTAQDLCLMNVGLNFQDKSIIKPSFIKGLILTMNKVLEKLEYFEDENIAEMPPKRSTMSFVQANAKAIELRKSLATDKFMQSMASTRAGTVIQENSHRDSPEANISKIQANEAYFLSDESQVDSEEDIDDNEYKCFIRKSSAMDEPVEPMLPQNNVFNNTMSFRSKSNFASMMIPSMQESYEYGIGDRSLRKTPSKCNHNVAAYKDQIKNLEEQLKEVNDEKELIKTMMKEDADYKIESIRKTNKLRISSLSESLQYSQAHCDGLGAQLEELLEQLCKSEQYIKNAIKAINHQDEVHQSTVKFYSESEKLLKAYYEQKLSVCAEQIALREKPAQADMSCQTEEVSDPLTEQMLIDCKQLDDVKQVKDKYEQLYNQSVNDLKYAYTECIKVQDQLKLAKRQNKALQQKMTKDKMGYMFMMIFMFIFLIFRLFHN